MRCDTIGALRPGAVRWGGVLCCVTDRIETNMIVPIGRLGVPRGHGALGEDDAPRQRLQPVHGKVEPLLGVEHEQNVFRGATGGGDGGLGTTGYVALLVDHFIVRVLAIDVVCWTPVGMVGRQQHVLI